VLLALKDSEGEPPFNIRRIRITYISFNEIKTNKYKYSFTQKKYDYDRTVKSTRTSNGET